MICPVLSQQVNCCLSVNPHEIVRMRGSIYTQSFPCSFKLLMSSVMLWTVLVVIKRIRSFKDGLEVRHINPLRWYLYCFDFYAVWLLNVNSSCSSVLLFITTSSSSLSLFTPFCSPSRLPCIDLYIECVCARWQRCRGGLNGSRKTEAVLFSFCLSVSHAQPRTE